MPNTLLPFVISPLLELLNYAGIAVFAVSGALVAAEKRRDLVTFVFFAVVAGIGGGTVRDVLLDTPVFWIGENMTLLICILAAVGVWLTPVEVWPRRALLWFDAIGLAAFATYGAAKGLALGVSPIPAFSMGIVTACMGGMMRDILAGEPSILMRSELYVTAAALSSGLLVLLTLAGMPSHVAAVVATAAGLFLRGGSLVRGWELPTYRR